MPVLIALSFCLTACTTGGILREKHERGFTVAYDGGFWEIAPLSDGFVFKEKRTYRSTRAVTVTLAGEGELETSIQSNQGPAGQMHSIHAGKRCPNGVILLNASYQSENPPDFRRELQLLERADCPD